MTQLPLPDGALAFDVRRPRLEPRHVLLVQLQFGRVLDRDDTLALADEARQHVEQRGLAGAGAAADQHVQPGAHAVREKVEHRLRQRAQRDEVVGLQPLGRETADREQRAVDRQRRNDRVDARAVGEPRVDHRRAVVDAAADAADDAVDDAQQVASSWNDVGTRSSRPRALDEHVLVGVDQDVADRRIAQQRLERPEPEDFVDQLAEQDVALAQAERRSFFGEQLADQRADLAFGARAIGVRQRLEIQPVEQLAVDVRLQLDVLRADAPAAPRRRRRTRVGRRCGQAHGRLPEGGDFRGRAGACGRAALCCARRHAFGSSSRRVNWSNWVAMSELPAIASGTPELSAAETVL